MTAASDLKAGGLATRFVPIESLPRITPLARALGARDESVREFLPDPPDLGTIAGRAREVLARFVPRDGAAAPAGLGELAAGRRAGVFTGQQAGLFTGPLLTLTKALAAADLGAAVSRAGVDTTGVFWCASEDHDLVEVTRFVVPGPDGSRDLGPDAAPLAANRAPVGALPISLDVDNLLDEAAKAVGRRDEEALAALAEASRGRTYHDAFVATLAWLLEGTALPTYDAARRADKPDLVPLASRLVTERVEVRRILGERAARLEAAGHALQVKTDPEALPLFAIAGGERFLLRAEGARFVLKGHPDERTYEEAEVLARFAGGEWLPSFSALSRPLAQSLLFPVAAVVLGPAEIAYWAQSHPLFAWAGIVPPVIVPRPLVAVVEPSARRALDRLGLGIEDVLAGPDAILRARGAAAASGLIRRLADHRAASLSGLDALKEELVAVDESLGKAHEVTRDKLDFALGKLEERAAAAAGRAEEGESRQVGRLATALAPNGALAERVYTPVSLLLTLGRAGLMEAMREAVSWERSGLTVVDAR